MSQPQTSARVPCEEPDSFIPPSTSGSFKLAHWTFNKLILCDLCLTLCLYLGVVSGLQNPISSPWFILQAEHTLPLFNEFAFQPDILSRSRAREYNSLLRAGHVQQHPLTDVQNARGLLRRTRRTSALVMALDQVCDKLSAGTFTSPNHWWLLINYGFKILIALSLYCIASTITSKLGDRVDTGSKYIFMKVQEEEREKLELIERERASGELNDGAYEKKKNDLKLIAQEEYASKGNQAWSALLPPAIFLLHPLSLYASTAAPSAAYIPLFCLITAFSVTLCWPNMISAVCAASLLGVYGTTQGSFLFISCLPILARLAMGDSFTLTHRGPTLDQILKWTGYLVMLTSVCLVAYATAAYLLFGFSDLGEWSDYKGFWEDTEEFMRRRWNFTYVTPNTGTYWHLMIVMFDSARPIFAAFIHIHLTLHTIPLTLRLWNRREIISIVFMGLTLMFEPDPSAVIWPLCIALLFTWPGLLIQHRLAVLALVVMHMAIGLQIYVFDLWFVWDVANSTVALNTVIVPFITLVIAIMSILLTDYRLCDNCVGHIEGIDTLQAKKEE